MGASKDIVSGLMWLFYIYRMSSFEHLCVTLNTVSALYNAHVQISSRGDSTRCHKVSNPHNPFVCPIYCFHKLENGRGRGRCRDPKKKIILEFIRVLQNRRRKRLKPLNRSVPKHPTNLIVQSLTTNNYSKLMAKRNYSFR